MSKRKSFIFIGIFILVSLLNQSQLNAKHSKFLETMVFPVKNIMSHFYDDWGEIRGNGERVHEGIDIRARKGSPIVAIADGRVNTVSFTQSSGYYIAIDHQNGWLSLYVHLYSCFILSRIPIFFCKYNCASLPVKASTLLIPEDTEVSLRTLKIPISPVLLT